MNKKNRHKKHQQPQQSLASGQDKKLHLYIHGMHCTACEVLVERKFKKIEGVENVQVNHATGKAEVTCSRQPSTQELNEALEGTEYTVSLASEPRKSAALPVDPKKSYIEAGAVFLIIAALYFLLSGLHLLPKGLSISDHMSYGFIFLIGLVAAMSSCIAVSGGLLLSVAAKFNEINPNRTGIQKFRPHIYFNVGRIVSYTLLGGVVGAIGSAVTLSTQFTGLLTIAASLVMIVLGFQLLNIFPWMKRLTPKMPKFIAHKIHDAATGDSKAAPFLLGASTFFLPCGFTQALQLYVLSKGSFTIGAFTMLAFSLGTLPALMSIGALSSFTKGNFQRYFFKFSGALVIILGLTNINNGLALAGSTFSLSGLFQGSVSSVAQDQAADTPANDPNVKLVNGKQVVSMKVDGYTYTPSHFTVAQGVPVEWHIDGSAAQGCAQVLTVPSLGITEYLPTSGEKVINFTPQNTGNVPFFCPMGMTTRGAAFMVVTNTKPVEISSPAAVNAQGTSAPTTSALPPQKLAMEISAEKGFYPNSFTVKVNQPVELDIDAKIVPSGCMGTMLIPKYNVAHVIALGKSSLTFTPTQTGTVLLTCSMGTSIGKFAIIN